MGADRITESSFESSTCPRVGERCTKFGEETRCPALAGIEYGPGSPGHLDASVQALMGCRSFLWDVLMDGGWTGCARQELRKLTALYGPLAVSQAFEE